MATTNCGINGNVSVLTHSIDYEAHMQIFILESSLDCFIPLITTISMKVNSLNESHFLKYQAVK